MPTGQSMDTAKGQGYGNTSNQMSQPVLQQGSYAHDTQQQQQSTKPASQHHSRSPSPAAQPKGRKSQAGGKQHSRTPSPAPNQRTASPGRGKQTSPKPRSQSPAPTSAHATQSAGQTVQGHNAHGSMGSPYMGASPMPMPVPPGHNQHGTPPRQQHQGKKEGTKEEKKAKRAFEGDFPAAFAVPGSQPPVFNLSCRIICHHDDDPSKLSCYLKGQTHGLKEQLAQPRIFFISKPSNLPLLNKYQGDLDLLKVLEWRDAVQIAFPKCDGHETDGKRKTASEEGNREQAWRNLEGMYDQYLKDDYGDIPPGLFEHFRLDALGNVVSLHAGYQSMCSFSTDHIHPWSRGGTTEAPNLMALAEVANTDKTDQFWPFLIQWRHKEVSASSRSNDEHSHEPAVRGNFKLQVIGKKGKKKVRLQPPTRGLQVQQLKELWERVNSITVPSATGASPLSLGAAGPLQLLCTMLMMPWGQLLKLRSCTADTYGTAFGLVTGKELVSAASSFLVAAQAVPMAQRLLAPYLKPTETAQTTASGEVSGADDGDDSDHDNSSAGFSRSNTQLTTEDGDGFTSGDQGIDSTDTLAESDGADYSTTNVIDNWDSQLVSTNSMMQRFTQLVELVSAIQAEAGAPSHSMTVQTLMQAHSQLSLCEREHQGSFADGPRLTSSSTTVPAKCPSPQRQGAVLTPPAGSATPPHHLQMPGQQGPAVAPGPMRVTPDGFLLIPPGTPAFYDPVAAAAQRDRQSQPQGAATPQQGLWVPSKCDTSLPAYYPTAAPMQAQGPTWQGMKQPLQAGALTQQYLAEQGGQTDTSTYQQQQIRAGVQQYQSWPTQLPAQQQYPASQFSPPPAQQHQALPGPAGQYAAQQAAGCAAAGQQPTAAYLARAQLQAQTAQQQIGSCAGAAHKPAMPGAAGVLTPSTPGWTAGVPVGQAQQPMPAHLQPQSHVLKTASPPANPVVYLGSRPAVYASSSSPASQQGMHGESNHAKVGAGMTDDAVIKNSSHTGQTAATALKPMALQAPPVQPADGNCVHRVWTRMFG